MKKLYIVIILVVAIVLGLIFFGSNPTPVATETSADNLASVALTDNATTSTTYTMADVVLHKDTTSCWTVVRGSVYDLTAWVSKHPGGPGAIIKICGADGTDLFVNKHGGREKQEDVLTTFKIGELTE